MQFGSSVDRWLFRVTRAECSFFLKKKLYMSSSFASFHVFC
jgi:hypothetical protein